MKIVVSGGPEKEMHVRDKKVRGSYSLRPCPHCPLVFAHHFLEPTENSVCSQKESGKFKQGANI